MHEGYWSIPEYGWWVGDITITVLQKTIVDRQILGLLFGVTGTIPTSQEKKELRSFHYYKINVLNNSNKAANHVIETVTNFTRTHLCQYANHKKDSTLFSETTAYHSFHICKTSWNARSQFSHLHNLSVC